MLNHIRSSRLASGKTLKVLSVDYFAFRRVARYGTILVYLELHTPVGVLPYRSADSFARWLREHPGVKLVSRGRGGEYAEAARRVAPHTVQVVDPFHLLKNLKEVVSRVFRQHTEVLDLVPSRSPLRGKRALLIEPLEVGLTVKRLTPNLWAVSRM